MSVSDFINMDVPSDAVSVLIRQGGYQDLIRKYFFLNRFFLRWPLDEKKVLSNHGFVSEFIERKRIEVNEYAASILSCCQGDVASVLDVGAGLGLVDLVLYKKMKSMPSIYLLDKKNEHSPLSPVKGGFKDRYIFTADFDLTRQIFKSNGVDDDKLIFVDPSNSAISKLPKIDLVLSLTSWGFHYPIETYWDSVKEILHDRSVLYIDLRKNKGGFDFLKENFKYYSVVKSTASYDRVAFSDSEFDKLVSS